ncbi:hypothetical protein AgCh_008519 [Apium graveolens]
MAYSTAARKLSDWNLQHSINIKTMAELDEPSNNGTNGTLGNCWNAIAEIKSCTNEISVYFKIGAIDIGLPCCQAIKMITQHCWPSMLTALGISPDQSNILVGYCDASVSVVPSPSPVAAAVTCLMAYSSAASKYPESVGELNHTSRTTTGIETVFNCWNTITNIGSCANEIMDFFARGTVDHISKRCRKEINLIMRKCWPDLFTALGITPEECNFLLGFCKPSSGSLAPRPFVRYPTPPAKKKKVTPGKRLGTKA